MGENNKNENVHIERLDNTKVKRPILLKRILKASPTRQILSYIEAYGYPVLPIISALEKTPEERAIAKNSYVAKQAEERLKKKGLLIRENIGFVPLIGDFVDTGITGLEIATGKEEPYMMGASFLGFLPFGDWFKKYFKTFNESKFLRRFNQVQDNPNLIVDNYIKRTGRIPEDPMDDLKILKDGMNVKLLYIEDQILTVLKQSPDMTREQATELVDEVLREQGYSIDDVLNAKGLSVTFDMPENLVFDGVYAAADKNPYSRNITKVHEDNHLSRKHNSDISSKENKEYNTDGFREPLNEKERYYHNQEKSSFGTEILSILGKDSYNLTGEELKYLYNNRHRLPLLNGVKDILNMITDFDKAAKWINSHSNVVTGATITGIGLPAITGLNNEK